MTTTHRRESREWAVQFLFQTEVNPQDLDKALVEFWSERKPSDSARRFAEDLIRGVLLNIPELDASIRKYAEHWDLSRMGIVDRTVMRLGLFEMLHRPDIPPVVSINEAVDLARDFSDSASGKFVNGILDRARKDLDRPARKPQKKRGESAA